MTRLILAAALMALGVLTIGIAVSAYAVWSNSFANTGNDFDTDTLNPPAGLAAQSGVSVILNWTATSDIYASGHRVLRSTSPGGPYSQIAQVTPRTETTYTDNPAAGTYYYVVRAYYQSWESANSGEGSATKTNTASTGFHNPNAHAAVTTASGDNNGFETNPTRAFTDSTFYAEDLNSGTGTSTSCSDAGKDRHQYYDYDFGIPTGSTVDGIEVRLDAWADSTVGSPFMCVELSWDGGATWTAAKNTAILGTAEATFTLGTTTDTWGRTWSASDFSNTNFRVRVTSVASDNTRDFRLDWVAASITYTPPAGFSYTGFRNCASQAAVATNSGDNNGFQTNPGNACADDGAYAEDLNSGSATGTSCTGTDKDRHLFYDYGFTIPTGSTINGIEVRLDNWVDSSSTGNPLMCVELSWDGGATWTATQSTYTLSTFEITFFRGSPIDAWGRTWSVSDFSNANFRVRITDVATSTARDFRLDWVAVQVTYSPP